MASQPSIPRSQSKGAGELVMSFISVLRRLKELRALTRAEDGQALVEYALLISLVALTALVAVESFGLGVSSLYSTIVSVYP
jgi:Flp pilus assembly pilin Flp